VSQSTNKDMKEESISDVFVHILIQHMCHSTDPYRVYCLDKFQRRLDEVQPKRNPDVTRELRRRVYLLTSAFPELNLEPLYSMVEQDKFNSVAEVSQYAEWITVCEALVMPTTQYGVMLQDTLYNIAMRTLL
jgi:hypothetical protein